jgi:hypothetical protein
VALDGLLDAANNPILLSFSSQTFSNLYFKIVNQCFWNLSEADLAIVNSPAVGQAQQLVWAATQQDGYPSTASAGWGQFIFYTMNNYAIGQPKTNQGLAAAANNMSLAYPNVSHALTTYVNTQSQASAIQLTQLAAMQELSAAQNNTSSPVAANGALQTGPSSYYVGYGVPVWATLTAGLNNVSNAVSVGIALNHVTTESAYLEIGTASFSEEIGFFSIGFESSTSSYNFSSYTTSSSVVTLNVDYTGITSFGSMPSALSTNNATGWYDDTVLQQIGQTWNNTQGITGYAIGTSTAYQPPSTFGVGKTFGRLKTWVISNPPTVSFTVTDANVSAMSAAFQEGTVVTSLSLFGASTGFSSSGYQVSSYAQEGTTVTVTISATAVPLLPPTEQIAFVLGGVASYPPANT